MPSEAAESNAAKAILAAGFVCGVLDGLAAIVLTAALGGATTRMFQGIARGLEGAAALQQGTKSVLLGVALHFVIAIGAAAVYYLASRVLPVLIDRALIWGVLYGIAVHLFMTFVVIPLSAIGPRPFALRVFLYLLAIHMVVVGPSISLVMRRYLLEPHKGKPR
jgi:uncharacterized membrane protein YagU involved in acid resistance